MPASIIGSSHVPVVGAERGDFAVMAIRVLHVGLGPIGVGVVRQCASRKGFKIVGAVDLDPAKIGRDLGEVAELGRVLQVPVTGKLGAAIKAGKPDVVVLCTSSSLAVATSHAPFSRMFSL